MYAYKVVDQALPPEPLKPENVVQLTRFVFNLGRKNYVGREIKWFAEKNIQPLLEKYPQSRNQIVTEEGIRKIRVAHSELIDLAQSLGGSFYLPYQLSATRAQIDNSYPEFGRFLEIKKQYDADLLFTSTFYQKYGTM